MKTARVSLPPVGVTGSMANNNVVPSPPAADSVIDAYANKVLETKSPPGSSVDTSLGPYITALLRCADLANQNNDVTLLPEFESLLELLEDHCDMPRDIATESLDAIAAAVRTGSVPNDTTTFTPNPVMGPYGNTGLDSLQMFGIALREAESANQSDGLTFMHCMPSSIDPYTPTSTGGPSPLKPDNLIPVDLMGVLDDPSPAIVRHGHRPLQMVQEEEQKNPLDEDEAFPPLGAAGPAPSSKRTGGNRNKRAPKTEAKELAAALFRPSRPRQNSIENEEAVSSQAMPGRVESQASSNQFFQQQLESAVEILLSMNPDLSEEAAMTAATMADADFNIAQYIVDCALTAPPVCRHMLNDGCYRSDCQFSHDVEGHTCVFWLRGRCGKGPSCRFFHGFNEKYLHQIHQQEQYSTAPTQSYRKSAPIPIATGNRNNNAVSGNQYGSMLSSSAPMTGYVSDAYRYNKGPSSSWEAPSVVESMSNSYSPSEASTGKGISFANIASKGYGQKSFAPHPAERTVAPPSSSSIGTVKIPQDLWNPHENRDAAAFHTADPIERYYKVATWVQRKDVLDLHFQSTKTFSVVLSKILPQKLSECKQVWIVTGTGHHVGSKTHQKSGGALENSVISWLSEEGYTFFRGRDRNGQGGAVLVNQ